MVIDVLTLFPDMFNYIKDFSIIKRAIDKNLVTINIHNIRDYALAPHYQVDDTPYGGGGGMVLMCEPIFKAIETLKQADSKVIMMTPDGTVYKQENAYNLAELKHIILLCGHYEGFDERIRTIVDLELSIGDYILTGGEIPSMVVIDSVVRLIDGVIKEESHLNESFNNKILDYPQYTKPADFKGMKVPEVLISGHHLNIKKWRLEKQIEKTNARRPDLLR